MKGEIGQVAMTDDMMCDLACVTSTTQGMERTKDRENFHVETLPNIIYTNLWVAEQRLLGSMHRSLFVSGERNHATNKYASHHNFIIESKSKRILLLVLPLILPSPLQVTLHSAQIITTLMMGLG